ncbi:MAG: lipopolysaccharide kinase InaA family protein [Planctomycetota bacterium]
MHEHSGLLVARPGSEARLEALGLQGLGDLRPVLERGIVLERTCDGAAILIENGSAHGIVHVASGREGEIALSREASWLARMERMGPPFPRLLARAELAEVAALVLDLPASVKPLDVALLAAEEKGDAAMREELLAAGRAATRIHRAGVVHGTLMAWKLLVTTSGDVVAMDFRRARWRKWRDPWGRFDDLAQLVATIPARMLRGEGLEAFLCAAGVRRRLGRRVVRVGVLREHLRGLAPRLIPSFSLGGSAFTITGHGAFARLFPVAQDEQQLLDQARSFEQRRTADRINRRVEVPAPGGDITLYMKSYPDAAQAMRAGPREWSRHLLLRGAGLPTALPAITGKGPRGSFFMAHRIPEGRPLDRLLERDGFLSGRDRGSLARALGRLVAGLHEAGFCHRDLYLCHVFWSPSGLRLIDLHRVEEFLVVPRRWRVKDLAALHYSSLATGVRPKDRLRVLKAYLGGEAFWARRAKRRWIAAVERKAARIERHAGPPRVGGPEL